MNIFQTPRLTALTFVVIQPLQAQDLFWNAPLTGNQRNGNWTKDAFWNTSPNGNPADNSLWSSSTSSDGAAALFQQPEGGLITLGSDVNLGRISAGEGGVFEITSDLSVLRQESGLFFIEVSDSAAGELIISADLAASELVKTGNGRLVFRGTTDGNLTIDGGEVVFSGDNLGEASIIDTLPGTRTILEGDLNVAELLANGTITGPGQISASTYRLLDGARVESDLGPGRVLLGGDGRVEILGSLQSEVINVPGGTLGLSGGNLPSLTQLSVSGAGTLNLQGDQTVGSYLQVGDGSLTGSGVLSPTFGALLRGGEVAGHLNGESEVLGDTVLSGSLTGPLTTIQTGNLLVTGSLLSDEIQILETGTLTGQGQFGANSEIQNSGILQLDSEAALSRYIQNAGALLAGNATLTASNGATIRGGSLAGSLTAATTVTGDLSVPGLLDGSLLALEAGHTEVSGTLASANVEVQSGSRLTLSGDFDQVVRIGNEAILMVERNGGVDQYFQGGSGSLEGDGIFSATRATLAGGLIEGHLRGDITVTGDLLVPGTLSGESLSITGGTTEATGPIDSKAVTLEGATLVSSNGSLSPAAALALDQEGTLKLLDNESIATLNNRGQLEGPGSLTVSSANLLDGSRLALPLQGPVVSSGNVTVLPAGSISGMLLELASGTLAAHGPLDANEILVGPLAELIDSATATFSPNSTLENKGRVILSGTESLGALLNRNGGQLVFSIFAPDDRDYLKLGAGGLVLEDGSVLLIDEPGLELGQSTRIIQGPIEGSFDEVRTTQGADSNLRFTFDPSQGTLQALPGVIIHANNTNRLFNLTRNQTQLFGNAFEQVYRNPASGGSNFRRLQYRATSNPDGTTSWVRVVSADGQPGDLAILDLDPGRGRTPLPEDRQGALLHEAVSAVEGTFQPAVDDNGTPLTDLNNNPIAEAGTGGKDLLDQLSPESYASFGQISGEVLRTQMRRLALHKPFLGNDLFAVTSDLQFANGGSLPFPSGASSNWDYQSFSLAIHRQLDKSANVGLLLGVSDGGLDQGARNFDASGNSIGLFGNYQFQDRYQTHSYFGLGLGNQEFDGSRPGFGGNVRVDGVEARALELSLGASSLIWDRDNIILRPRASMRYLRTEVNGFDERGPGLGLEIDDFENDSFLFEAGIDAQFKLNEASKLHLGFGLVHDFASQNQNLTSTFPGGDPFSIRTSSPNVSAVVLSSGASLKVRENLEFFIDLRGEFRENTSNFRIFSISGAMTF